jgi:integrating conjugative element protein (TIGR03756 family)
MIKKLLYLFCLFNLLWFSIAKTYASSSVTSLTITQKVMEHYLEYTHYKVIGLCFWKKCDIGCTFPTTLELDEYLPDLVVTVANKEGDNPWMEANEILDKGSFAIGNEAMQQTTGFGLANGNSSSQKSSHYDSLRMKTIDVIGNPAMLIHFPFLTLQSDTTAYVLYYQSDLDTAGRLGLAESIRLETWNPVGNPIGKNALNHWGYEFPRSMSVNVDNDYKASLIAALHAVDIVTNKNTLHVVKSVENTCGDHCAVSNVIEEQKEDHAIWQEIYPYDRHVHIGEDDSLQLKSEGMDDNLKGHGNYVFVVWRHYQGCVQSSPDASLIGATKRIKPTIKR